jgi:hypothetical protein
MKYFSNKKGSVLAVAAIMVFLLVLAFMELGRVYYSTVNILEDQNKKDAHMLSVIGLYVETLDTVSWINKQLQRIAMLCAAASLVPGLAPMMRAAQTISMGLEKYQDFLLLRLKVYAPVLDLELRRQNDLSLLPNYHYVEYRRRMGVDLGFFKIPALIEFKREIFETACIKDKGIIIDSEVCVDHNDYRDTKDEWFAPTEDKWFARFTDA